MLRAASLPCARQRVGRRRPVVDTKAAPQPSFRSCFRYRGREVRPFGVAHRDPCRPHACTPARRRTVARRTARRARTSAARARRRPRAANRPARRRARCPPKPARPPRGFGSPLAANPISDHARGRAARDARRVVRVARRRDDGLPTTRRPCPIRARCAFNALSAHARHGGRGAHIAAAKIAMTCASVALRGLVSMHASFCALPAITSWSSAFTPSAARPDGMPIDAESARIAAMAARAASGVLMPAVLTPSSGAMAAKRSGAAIRLNSHTCGSRIALQTPCGRL